MTGTLRIQPLSAAEISSVYEKCVAILSGHGVKVDHAPALELLRGAGADVDFATSMVRFERETIEEALRVAPSGFTAKGAAEKHDLPLPHPARSFYTSSCIQSMLYHDPSTGGFHDVTEERFAEWCQLIEVLPNIDACAIQTPMDAPAETADIHALNVQLQNTSKPLNLLAYCRESVPYLFELILARAGSEEALRERPLLVRPDLALAARLQGHGPGDDPPLLQVRRARGAVQSRPGRRHRAADARRRRPARGRRSSP